MYHTCLFLLYQRFRRTNFGISSSANALVPISRFPSTSLVILATLLGPWLYILPAMAASLHSGEKEVRSRRGQVKIRTSEIRLLRDARRRYRCRKTEKTTGKIRRIEDTGIWGESEEAMEDGGVSLIRASSRMNGIREHFAGSARHIFGVRETKITPEEKSYNPALNGIRKRNTNHGRFSWRCGEEGKTRIRLTRHRKKYDCRRRWRWRYGKGSGDRLLQEKQALAYGDYPQCCMEKAWGEAW